MLYAFGDGRVRMKAFRLLHMVARRGNSRDFPENSLAALRSALSLGARFIEFDVNVGLDGAPIVGQTHLESVVSLFVGRPEITAFVVLTDAGVRKFGREQVIAKVSHALQPLKSRCVLASTDLATTHRARFMTGFPVGWILPSYDDHTRLKYEAVQPDYLFCDRAYIPAGTRLWRGPWRWVVYEVDSLQTALNFATRGAHFVSTRDVRALGEGMRSHAVTH
jgi:glycerophosphoryl diester phosphodiesterase